MVAAIDVLTTILIGAPIVRDAFLLHVNAVHDTRHIVCRRVQRLASEHDASDLEWTGWEGRSRENTNTNIHTMVRRKKDSKIPHQLLHTSINRLRDGRARKFAQDELDLVVRAEAAKAAAKAIVLQCRAGCVRQTGKRRF